MIFLYIICLLAFGSASVAIAEQRELNTLSLEDVNRKLENPLSDLWSLTIQENLMINTGDLVDGSVIENNFFFQPFLPFPIVTQPVIDTQTGTATDHITGLYKRRIIINKFSRQI